MPGSQFHDMKRFLIRPPPLRTGDQKKCWNCFPYRIWNGFLHSVMPKSFTWRRLAFAMKCRDWVFLFCLMCPKHVDRVIWIFSRRLKWNTDTCLWLKLSTKSCKWNTQIPSACGNRNISKVFLLNGYMLLRHEHFWLNKHSIIDMHSQLAS